ncbi:hypothetical protein IV417_14760 [Alphaproteobacteria bacterium KMM 3653]|uniref:Uncharacterized protein n=2 Tax=Harenicola maris TaxID=2841044 RepID=A0AAP2G9R1_9RHOB|nr:hypothetical protein [Harenicola maris]
MADAARLLPIFGLVLFLLPSLWVPGNEQGATVRGAIYLFVVWALLIALAALISRRLGATEPAPEDPAPDPALPGD